MHFISQSFGVALGKKHSPGHYSIAQSVDAPQISTLRTPHKVTTIFTKGLQNEINISIINYNL